MIDTILFDLDGTLLPMDQDAFTEYDRCRVGWHEGDGEE